MYSTPKLFVLLCTEFDDSTLNQHSLLNKQRNMMPIIICTLWYCQIIESSVPSNLRHSASPTARSAIFLCYLGICDIYSLEYISHFCKIKYVLYTKVVCWICYLSKAFHLQHIIFQRQKCIELCIWMQLWFRLYSSDSSFGFTSGIYYSSRSSYGSCPVSGSGFNTGFVFGSG